MERSHTLRHALIAAALMLVPLVSSAQTVGTEFLVNGYVVDNQHAPAVAPLQGGGFVIVWQSERQDGDLAGVYAQRFDALGVRVGGEFRVNATTAGSQYGPSVAAFPGGGFVVAWAHDDGLAGIRAQLFSSSGDAIGPEIEVVQSWTAVFPSVAAANDRFVVTWLDRTTDANPEQLVRARRFDSFGNALGDPFDVSMTSMSFDGSAAIDPPSIAADSRGNFVVAWSLHSYAICYRFYNAAGVAQTDEVTVDASGDTTATLRKLTAPAVAMAPSGDFIVAWESQLVNGGAPLEVLARRYSAAPAALTAAFRVNATPISSPLPLGVRPGPSVAFDATGRPIVVWTSDRIYGRWYTAAGVAIGGDLVVNPNLMGGTEPAVAGTGDGTFVATWTDGSHDGNGSAVFAQRLRIGADLVVSAFTAPATAASGATISLSATVLNQGAVPARSTLTDVRFSTDSVANAGDAAVTSWTTGNLNPGQSEPVARSVTLPVVPPGTYYLVASADTTNLVAEASETNNSRPRAIAIGPDLVVAGLAAPADAVRGSHIYIADVTRNVGAARVAGSTTRFYLSADSVITRFDLSLGSRSIPSLQEVPVATTTCNDQPAACSTGVTEVVIPIVAPGTYYLVAVADWINVIPEASETNNSRSVMIRIH